MLAMSGGNAYNKCMQYTIRNVPDYVDSALRSAAREQGKSLNDVIVEALVQGSGSGGVMRRQRDLTDIAGTWQEDPAFDAAIAEQDKVDESLWR